MGFSQFVRSRKQAAISRFIGDWLTRFSSCVLSETNGARPLFVLAIVVLSPDGVMGLWRAADRRLRGFVDRSAPAEGLAAPSEEIPA